jgi:hypothetical protein
MRLVIATLVLLALAPHAVAGDDTTASAPTVLDRFGLASTTGQSPWLVMAARGAYQYFTTPADQQNRLSITARPWFFGTLSVLLLLVAIKDSVLTFLGPMKMPLDVLGELFHVAGGAAGIAYLGDVAFSTPDASVHPVADVPQTTSWLLPTLTWLMASIVHLAVWVVFNSIEVAIILNPFPFVDTALKSARTTLVGILSGASAIHPILGFLLALPIFLCCVFVMPIALRMTRLGWVFCFDTLARWFGLAGSSLPQQTMAFTWGRLPGVSLLAYGVVSRTAEGGLVYTVRRMGVLWHRAVPLPADCYVGIGTLTPMLLSDEGGTATDLLLFPPRYNGREPALAQQLGIGRVENVSLGASLRAFWRRLRGKDRATQPQTT